MSYGESPYLPCVSALQMHGIVPRAMRDSVVMNARAAPLIYQNLLFHRHIVPSGVKTTPRLVGFFKKFLPLERGRHHHHIAQKGLHGVRFCDRLYHKKVHCHRVYSYRRKSHHIVLAHGLVVISTSFLEGPLQYVRKRVNEGLVNSLRTATRSVLSLRRRDGVSDEGASTPRNHVILAV